MGPFLAIWTGQATSLLGSMLVQFALVWWLNESTDSATVLATATLMAILPQVFLTPFAGGLVDRWDRRLVMIGADALIALAIVGLAYLFAVGAMRVWHVYAVMFIRAALGGFHWPAMQASTSLMVPEEHLPRVAGLNQALHGGINILAPPLGALLLNALPLPGIMAIDVGTAVLAIVPLLFVHIPQPERRATEHAARGRGRTLWGDVKEGLRYVWDWPGLRAVVIMSTVINFLFNPAFALMPRLVTHHFRGGAIHLGSLEAAWGVGVVLGGLGLGVWGGFRRRVVTSLVGVMGMGVALFVFGMVPAMAFWLGLGSLFAAGLMHPIANGPLMAVMQARVAPDMQGRVFTVVVSAATAVSPLGLVIAGPLADLFDVRLWYVAGGVLCALAGVSGLFIPAVVHLEDNGHRAVRSEGAEGPPLAADVAHFT